jgi:hypothetical protein
MRDLDVPDTAQGDLRLHLLPTTLAHCSRIVSESTVVYLRQQRCRLRM